MKVLYPFSAILSFALSACAMIPPSTAEMSKVPVVRFGESAPATPFVLLYPAGTPLPVIASVTGTLLEKGDQARLNVALKRDIYVYQHWASFDGEHWERGDKLVKGAFRIRLPGDKDGHTPGSMAAEFDLK